MGKKRLKNPLFAYFSRIIGSKNDMIGIKQKIISFHAKISV